MNGILIHRKVAIEFLDKKKEGMIISVFRNDYALFFCCVKKVKSNFNIGCRSPPKVQFKKF